MMAIDVNSADLPTAVGLDRASLLPALNGPALRGITFLNEIIDTFPDAISFAPGAPHPDFFDELDVSASIERYTRYLYEVKGLSPAQVQRRLYQYGPSKGQINDLLSAALLVDEQIFAPPEAIVVTVGCQEAMVLVLRALCPRDSDLLAIVNPCFVGISGAAQVLGVEAVAIDETNDGIDIDALRAACRNARREGKTIRALYVAPDYSNPSGILLSLSARHQLLELAEQEDFLLLEDNAYGFTADKHVALPTLKALDQHRRVIYLGTCAKTCLPGVRVGFVVADQRVASEGGAPRLLADELALIKSMVTVNTSPLCQAIVGGMILEKGGSLSAVGREKGAFYRRNLEKLLSALDAHISPQLRLDKNIDWNRPQGGFFVRMQLPVQADEKLLNLCAMTYGVLWTPMRTFYINDGGQRDIRLSCSYLTDGEIEEGVRRLAQFLSDPRVQ
jgi:(S)-3,5-dihydroxyphenylglycine transaminase